MMRFFKSTKNLFETDEKPSDLPAGYSAVGIDISQNAVAAVLLSGHGLGRIRLEKYTVAKLPKNIVKGSKIQDYYQLAAYLQHAYAQLRSSCKNIIAAMPQNLATLENLVYSAEESGMSLDEFAEAALEQISPLDEINYDCQATGISVSPQEEQILAVAVKKDDIEPRIEMFEQAGLSLSAMDLDLLAQRNAFAFWLNTHAPELADEKIAVFGIYTSQTYALIMQNGQILYKQETPVSTDQLVRLIQSVYRISADDAAAMAVSTVKPADYQAQIADKFNLQVAQEIQRVLQFYYTTGATDTLPDIRCIILTGAASQQAQLAESILRQTGIPAQCVNPAEFAERSGAIDERQFQFDAPSLTLAFGLALRGL